MKNSSISSTNGYASWMAILCFGLLLQILSFMSILLLQNSFLCLANKQSQMDLSSLSQASHIIKNNNYVRRCNIPKEELIEYFEMDMGKTHVTFEDMDTFIQVIQKQPNKTIEMNVYYDEKGVSGFEIQKK